MIIVSNRGPVTFSRSESGERRYSRGAGGLVTALNAVMRLSEGAVWVASARSEEDVEVARETRGFYREVEEGGGEGREGTLRVALVEHDERDYDLMYNHLANPLIWFVHHGLYDLPRSPNLGDDTRTAWEAYRRINASFAETVSEVASGLGDDEPTVLVHDYHLYTTPGELRERLGEGAFISFFLHIPWPEPDLWRVLPRYVREEVLASLLSSNVVAFHTRRYAEAFLATVREVPGAEVDHDRSVVRRGDREIWVRVYPISIDPEEFASFARSEAVIEEERRVRELPGKLLLRVDRMDLSKNIVRGFAAYERMFERHPETVGKVTFLAQLQPSREEVPEYAAYAREIEAAARRVNDRYGTADWTPVRLAMEDNFVRSVAAYKNYDALLVNAVRDGMNLVAKEGAIVNERGGVLVLSEGAGAFEELREGAVPVSPFDLDEQADAIHRALTMPRKERERLAGTLRSRVLENTIEDWVRAQLADIETYRSGGSGY